MCWFFQKDPIKFIHCGPNCTLTHTHTQTHKYVICIYSYSSWQHNAFPYQCCTHLLGLKVIADSCFFFTVARKREKSVVKFHDVGHPHLSSFHSSHNTHPPPTHLLLMIGILITFIITLRKKRKRTLLTHNLSQAHNIKKM